MEKRKIIIRSGERIHEQTVSSRAETAAIARDLAVTLRGGEVIVLSGELGAGKTAFVQELAKALGVCEQVTSPTFVLMKIYEIPVPDASVHFLCHVDAYRLGSAGELEAIGFGEYSGRADTVTALEWPEKVPDAVPAHAIHIRLEILM